VRVNIWAVLAILIVLFGMTRYLRDQKLYVDDPTASVCERRASRVTLWHYQAAGFNEALRQRRSGRDAPESGHTMLTSSFVVHDPSVPRRKPEIPHCN
jgi:hypothetical protein